MSTKSKVRKKGQLSVREYRRRKGQSTREYSEVVVQPDGQAVRFTKIKGQDSYRLEDA